MTPSKAFLIWGISGSGKDTQSQLLVDYIRSKNMTCPDYISIGDRLRKVIEENGEEGMSLFLKKVDHTVTTGGLLPEFVPIWIWTQWLKEYAGEETYYVMNGIARKPQEGRILADALRYLSVDEIYLIILEVSEEEVLRRLIKRGRADDTKERVKNRIEWYKEESVLGIEIMEKAGIKVIQIDGEGTIEEVNKRILDATKI